MIMRIFGTFCALAASLGGVPAHSQITVDLSTVQPNVKVATVEGRALMSDDLDKLLAAAGPAAAQNKKGFVQQYALLWRLAAMAEKAKLDQRSPLKESLEMGRLQMLASAQINETMNGIAVPADEQRKAYETNRERFAQVALKVIYIAYEAAPAADANGKKALNEAGAKAKAQKLLAEIRAGADFVKLVKEHSEDSASAAKNGDFGTVRRTDNVPDAIKTAVFALKKGQVSEPVRQPNGYYLFRAEDTAIQSYQEVSDSIYKELQQAAFKKWMDEMQRTVQVKIENEAYFTR